MLQPRERASGPGEPDETDVAVDIDGAPVPPPNAPAIGRTTELHDAWAIVAPALVLQSPVPVVLDDYLELMLLAMPVRLGLQDHLAWLVHASVWQSKAASFDLRKIELRRLDVAHGHSNHLLCKVLCYNNTL